MTKANNLELYLTRASELEMEPNFFMSYPYLKLSNIRGVCKDGWVWVEDQGYCMFPPLPIGDSNVDYMASKIWAMFGDAYRKIDKYYKFLDWQYIFRPLNFTVMAGGEWEIFRKNCRKWPLRNPDWYYNDKSPGLKEGGNLIGEWLEELAEYAEDGEFLARFAMFAQLPGIYRRFLYNKAGRLVGINAWDENWKYINYRICIVKPGEPYLAEFMRYLFYTDNEILEAGKLVNDGGTLGSPGLERFKDKMNPISKVRIYSYERLK